MVCQLGFFRWKSHGVYCYFVANGTNKSSGSRVRPKTLQVVDVPIIDNRQCEEWHASKGINVIIYDEMMCAGYRGGGKDSCQVCHTTFLGSPTFWTHH